MSDIGLVNGATNAHSEARCANVRDNMLLTLVLYSVVRGSEALAGDAAPEALNAHAPPAGPASTFSAASASAGNFTLGTPLSTTEFRPRPHPQATVDSMSRSFVMQEPMVGSETVWQQMAQFRSADRVRLLTLWQTRASSLSLQADKHGGPSLQWSSPWMIRNSASHGLLDRLITLPAHGGVGAARSSAPRPANSPAPRPADLAPAVK